MYFSPKVLAISFVITYVIEFVLWGLLIPNSVFRVDADNNILFQPRTPLLTLWDSFGYHSFYWTSPRFMPLNFYYCWILSYFGLTYYFKEGMEDKKKKVLI